MMSRAQNRAYIEPALAHFHADMKYKLHLNDHKGGWQHLSKAVLLRRLIAEIGELAEAILEGDPKNIRYEAADVGNFAMFIHDNAGREPYLPPTGVALKKGS